MTHKSVLVVDDNPVNVELTCVILELAGYEVRAADDADGALRELTRFKPDLILMDVQLPGMDGLELTRRLKADPNHADTPVVALTAYAMREDELAALSAGCSGYLSKPIDTRNFPSLIAPYFDPESRD